MNPFDLPPLAAVLDAAYTALLGLSALISPLVGGASAAVAIVLVTLAVRAALISVGVSQARAEQTRARLAPRLRVIQQRFRRDPERLQRETLALYRSEGASPFGGCLPVLLQAPIVGVLYAVFLHPTIAGHGNALLTATVFGVPLGSSLTGAIAQSALDLPTVLVCGGIVVVIALVGELTRRLLPITMPDTPGAGGMARFAGLLQFATAVVAVFVPLAAGIYLVITVVWTLVQRVALRRVYPLPSS